MKRIGVALLAVVAIVAASGCEPKMTITARDAEHSDTCGLPMHVVGKVTPADATPKVVLQQTTGGKWVDVKGSDDWDDYYDGKPPTARTATVSKTTGSYSIVYLVDWYGTRHFRVRSNGSGATSPGFYVTITATNGC